ncbi:MAG TPA: hypothetical protein DHV17_01580 [Chitinophagaceae bacterium]|nr:hypothetical protein [Chitinophagaceae bacterium]
MNNRILLTSAFIAASLGTMAQSAKNKTYAITGDGTNDFVWMNIRQVDLGTGQVTKTLFERSKTDFIMTDVLTKKSVDQAALRNSNIFTATDYPTGTLVAAAAYDPNSEKLFFTPMRNGELRWLDLSTSSDKPRFYTMKSDLLKQTNPTDEALNITRMVIGSDGYGYAMSNDATRFLRFSTGNKPVITELGNIIDAENSNGVSIHNKCTSWGGDMVADAFGKLYVISANHNVFVIDVDTRIATFKGTIKGLPVGYTTNAAAVNADGQLIVASANKFAGYYTVKLDDLTATAFVGSDEKYNASDFANGNLLLQKEADAARQYAMMNNNITRTSETAGAPSIFPNPVTNYSFNVLFDDVRDGRYSIVISDLAGRNLQTRTVSIGKGAQTERINLSRSTTKGVYLVKILNEQMELISVQKVVVQ